jgi:hypothetical protein
MEKKTLKKRNVARNTWYLESELNLIKKICQGTEGAEGLYYWERLAGE